MIEQFYKDKKILVTGAVGTVGSQIVKQLLSFDPAELRIMDNNETEIFFFIQEYSMRGNVFCFLGDIRDKDRVEKLSMGIDIIIHCAAYKHVQLSEYNPFDVVQTNIIGVENIIRAANVAGVSNVLFTSSDKAVNPTNVMGTSKLMGERLITATNAVRNSGTIFSSVRFGNVIGSRGSVVPLFIKQISGGGPVTLTDRRMTRFLMSIEQAAGLVLKSVVLSRGGEVFVTKMPVVKIEHLAGIMIELLGPRFGYTPDDIQIVEIGAKAGEKLYEELMSEEEVERSLELSDMFVITPAFKAIYKSISYEYDNIVGRCVKKSYVSASETPMDKDTLRQYLIDNKSLELM